MMIDKKEAILVFGTSTVKVKIDQLEKVSFEDFKKQAELRKKTGRMPSIDLSEKIKDFKSKLDIRGMRVEEALTSIQHFTDDAILLNIPEIRILHGKGNGVLRQITHQHLRNIPEVKNFKDEALEFGGHGITVVLFR